MQKVLKSKLILTSRKANNEKKCIECKQKLIIVRKTENPVFTEKY
jgi:hypothetical protein